MNKRQLINGLVLSAVCIMCGCKTQTPGGGLLRVNWFDSKTSDREWIQEQYCDPDRYAYHQTCWRTMTYEPCCLEPGTCDEYVEPNELMMGGEVIKEASVEVAINPMIMPVAPTTVAIKPVAALTELNNVSAKPAGVPVKATSVPLKTIKVSAKPASVSVKEIGMSVKPVKRNSKPADTVAVPVKPITLLARPIDVPVKRISVSAKVTKTTRVSAKPVTLQTEPISYPKKSNGVFRLPSLHPPLANDAKWILLSDENTRPGNRKAR